MNAPVWSGSERSNRHRTACGKRTVYRTGRVECPHHRIIFA